MAPFAVILLSSQYVNFTVRPETFFPSLVFTFQHRQSPGPAEDQESQQRNANHLQPSARQSFFRILVRNTEQLTLVTFQTSEASVK